MRPLFLFLHMHAAVCLCSTVACTPHVCPPTDAQWNAGSCKSVPYMCKSSPPPLHSIPHTHTVLDYANLLEKTLDYEADFVMILEDDMMPAWHALDKAYRSLTTELTIPHHQLGYVAFYSNAPRRAVGLNRITGNLGYEGGCTLTYARLLVPRIIDLLRGDPYAYPVDLAVGHLVDKELRLQSYERVPHLFQHNSKRSSYTAQVSN